MWPAPECGGQEGRDAEVRPQHRPDELDPANTIIAGDIYTLDKIFEPLYVTSPQGELTPWLATGYTLSTDLKTFTFTCAPGVKFSDGKPLVADDVVFSINRARHRRGRAAQLPRLRDQVDRGVGHPQGRHAPLRALGAVHLGHLGVRQRRSCRRTSAARARRSSSPRRSAPGPFTLQLLHPDAPSLTLEGQPALLAGGQAVPRRGRVHLRRQRQPAGAAAAKAARSTSSTSVPPATSRRSRRTPSLTRESLPGLGGRPARDEREAAAVRRPPRAPGDHLRDQPAGARRGVELRHGQARRLVLPAEPAVLLREHARPRLQPRRRPRPSSPSRRSRRASRPSCSSTAACRSGSPSPQIIQSQLAAINIDVTINPLDHSAFEATFQKFDYDMFIDYAINDISDPDEMASFELDYKDGGSESYWSSFNNPAVTALVNQAEARVQPSQAGGALRQDPGDGRRGRPVRPARLPAVHLRRLEVKVQRLRGQPGRRLPPGGRLASLTRCCATPSGACRRRFSSSLGVVVATFLLHAPRAGRSRAAQSSGEHASPARDQAFSTPSWGLDRSLAEPVRGASLTELAHGNLGTSYILRGLGHLADRRSASASRRRSSGSRRCSRS